MKNIEARDRGKLHPVGYEDNFYDMLYNIYADTKYPYFCTYYSVDHDKMVLSKNEFDGLSYGFLGENSTYRWKKIHMFPISKFDQVTFRIETDEESGVKQVYETNIEYPTMFGVEPIYGDIILVPNAANKNIITPFVITGDIEKSNAGSFSFIRAQVRAYPFLEKEIDRQVTDEYCYIDLFKAIYKLELAMPMLKSIEMKMNLERKLLNSYKNGLLEV